MNNSKTIFRDLIAKIQLNESKEELQTIAYTLLEHFLKLSRTDIIAEKLVDYNKKAELLEKVIERLNNHEPLQYVIGEAEFFGRIFNVTSAVLIPRPETEELIRIVKTNLKTTPNSPAKIVDIGTGSGCIPITLALEIANTEVYATDISAPALEIASQNATALNAQVHFIQHDILRDNLPLNNLNCVVSNPPYITQKERSRMKPNVLNHEPHLALFVPDDQPLLFYEAIATRAITALAPGGLLVFEINEQYGKGVAGLLADMGFREIEIIKDMYGKDRIVKGVGI